MKIVQRRFFLLAILLAVVGLFSATLSAQDEGDAWGKKKSSWVLLTPAERTQVQDLPNSPNLNR